LWLVASVYRKQGSGGGFLMIFRKRSNVHSKLYKVYKGSGYLNQYTSPVRQYTTPTAFSSLTT